MTGVQTCALPICKQAGEIAVAFGSLEELNGVLERLGLREE